MWLLAAAAAFALLAILLPIAYNQAALALVDRLPRLLNKRICLLIAHPDDEAMFFAPAVLALTRPETGNHVKILCLSSGNADGLGETRKKELVKSGMTLGLRQEDDVFVVDSPDFQDSMTLTWDPEKISALLCDAFAPHSRRPSSPSAARPTANIDVLVTFDANGVSSHPNHISLHAGARTFISNLLSGKPGHTSPVDLYTLTSVPFWRKYSAFLDILPTLASWRLGGGGGADESVNVRRDENGNDHHRSLLFFSALTGEGALPTARRAMIHAHKSQMVWFRYGWITLSRYMVINDLVLADVDPVPEAVDLHEVREASAESELGSEM
ncbi:putative deacetylase LmbE-like domain-containing protein [Plectosphaerella plurivora]|uniref:N-acetylglucosaminylphosphatidylinositol deacetylase n=1 Tax=Plectosphaerella plurivora TaxID=936078 RepID=A0A9P8VFG9_9PEZI|nr:putative deacetylase LmbE-like domain-containing protein [Plectosphaerella plurivora]